jgi:uncharacterized protein (TIGR03437 family)
MRKHPACLAFACPALAILLGSVSVLRAQYVVTFPGAASSNSTATVYEPSTFSEITSFSVPGAFELLNLSDGTKHYFVSNEPGMGLTEVDNTFSNPHPVGNFPSGLSAAALSPDGSRLVVATAPTSAGNTPVVYIFDTSTDDSLTPPQGLSVVVAVAASIVDIVVSYDSMTAFVLGNTGEGQSFLTAINLEQNKVTATLPMGQLSDGLAIGPNGLLYVSAQKMILEVYPATLTVTNAGAIAVDALPGRLAFTPDGQYGVAGNQTLNTGAGAVLLDLATHKVAYLLSTGLGAPLDKLMPASSSVIYAWSSAAQSLYTLQIGAGGITLNTPNVSGVNLSSVTAAGLSNDLGVPGRSYPQFLFVVSGGVLYRIDPATSAMSRQVALTSSPGDLEFWTPTATGNTPVTVLIYGNKQTVPLGGNSLPMVARFLDANGLPISGVPVDFSIGAGTVNPLFSATGADGFVQTIFTAGTAASDNGSFTLKVGNSPTPFTVNVGTIEASSASQPPHTISIVSGQGQIVLTNPSTGAALTPIVPFTVQVTSASGAPVPNAQVTFAWTSGPGSGHSSVVATNSAGQAIFNFQPPPLFPQQNSYESDTITATVPGVKSVSFYITAMAAQVVSGDCGATVCPSGIPFSVLWLPASSSRDVVITGIEGSTFPDELKVGVSTLTGNPIPNVGLQVYTGANPSVSNASCANPTGGPVALTNANGVATCNLYLNGLAGTAPLTVSVGGLVSFPGDTLTVEPGPPSQVNILSGNDQYATLGNGLPALLKVQVRDAFMNPLVGVPVNWRVASGTMTLTDVSSTTNSLGLAWASGIPTGTGIINVQVTAGSGSATFTILATVPAAVVKIIGGNGQSTAINLPFATPLAVQVSDAQGNVAPLSAVRFTVKSGSAAVSSSSVAADINGTASITAQAGPTSGPVSIVATSGSGSVTFSLRVLPLGPSNISIVNAASVNPGISPGSLALIEGNGLTPTIQGGVTSPSQMAGYSVTFGSTPAPILSLVNQDGTQQIGIQVPFELKPGANNILIQTPQGGLTLTGVMVSPVAPGLFTNGNPQSAFAEAVALRPDGSTVSATNPAQPGDDITLFATGLGLTVPLPATNVPGVPGQVVSDTVYAGVNHIGVEVVSASYQPGMIGVYAITIQIPLSVAPGIAQPVSIVVVDPTGTYTAPDVYLPIQ